MLKILLIDDDQDHNKILKVFIEKHGHKVLIATNANDGYQIVEENTDLDLILIDDIMPIMTGTELREKIKANLKNPPPMYILTGQTDYNKGYESNVLYKPIKNEDLEEILQFLC